jgi:AraC-like DNA-binding protein
MLPARSALEIAKGLDQGYCAQRTWLYAVLSTEVHAYAIWGVPDEDDLQGLLNLWDSSFDTMPQHAILADLRGLEVVNPRAFMIFADYFRTRALQLRAMVRDSCVLVSASLAGTVAAGFFGIMPAPFPVSTTMELEQARSRLGIAPADLVAYEQVRSSVQGSNNVAASVRSILEEDLLAPQALGVAKRLGLSERSMQRKLSDLGTSFSEELGVARIERAKTLLEQTGDSITQIAFAVGFSSLEQFSRSFRARIGSTPSAYRDSHARARP